MESEYGERNSLFTFVDWHGLAQTLKSPTRKEVHPPSPFLSHPSEYHLNPIAKITYRLRAINANPIRQNFLAKTFGHLRTAATPSLASASLLHREAGKS